MTSISNIIKIVLGVLLVLSVVSAYYFYNNWQETDRQLQIANSKLVDQGQSITLLSDAINQQNSSLSSYQSEMENMEKNMVVAQESVANKNYQTNASIARLDVSKLEEQQVNRWLIDQAMQLKKGQ